MRPAGYVVVALALLSAAGCSGGAGDGQQPSADGSATGAPTKGSPTTTGPSTSSTVATSSTTGSRPADSYPSAARAHTDAGGKAFIEYFFDELNAAYTKPRRAAMRALSDGGCLFCRKTDKDLEGYLARGERYTTSPVEVRHLTKADGAPSDQRYFAGQLRQTGSPLVAADGHVLYHDKQATGAVNIAVRWAHGRWVLYEVEHA
ncbi:DUF6318 family protein [Pedococcus sp. 5OH_020]|uniref:DUF6318 family protein n=1 Tax=Pedococcus sp. 5OH_020 TaxID=2989814 RepID=UPI003FA7018E